MYRQSSELFLSPASVQFFSGFLCTSNRSKRWCIIFTALKKYATLDIIWNNSELEEEEYSDFLECSIFCFFNLSGFFENGAHSNFLFCSNMVHLI